MIETLIDTLTILTALAAFVVMFRIGLLIETKRPATWLLFFLCFSIALEYSRVLFAYVSDIHELSYVSVFAIITRFVMFITLIAVNLFLRKH